MVEQSKAKIYLSGERGHTETEWFRSYNTFNFGSFQNENKTPFGPLYVCNEDTLAPNKSFSLSVERDTNIILVPTVGVIGFKENDGADTFVEAGQIFIHTVTAGGTIHLSNPLNDDLVNFLQLWLTNAAGTNKFIAPFDLSSKKNELLELFASNNSKTKLCIGKFAGRQEVEYCLQNSENGVFVFVIEGAFEVQYRLLEPKDSLAIWDIQKIELEALSNEAIILVLEVSGV